jgi:hypothetical protein
MPAPVIGKLAREAGRTEAEAEALWAKAKAAAKDRYGLPEGDRFYALVMGIFKRMLGLTDGEEHAVCGRCASPLAGGAVACTGCGAVMDGAKSVKLVLTEGDVGAINTFFKVLLGNRILHRDLMRYLHRVAKAHGVGIKTKET